MVEVGLAELVGSRRDLVGSHQIWPKLTGKLLLLIEIDEISMWISVESVEIEFS